MDGHDTKQNESLRAWFSRHKATWIPAGLGILLGALVAYLVPHNIDGRLAFLVGALVTVIVTCIGLGIKVAESEDRITSQTRNLVTLNVLAGLPESLREGIEKIVYEGQSLSAGSPFTRVASTSVFDAADIVKDAADGEIRTV